MTHRGTSAPDCGTGVYSPIPPARPMDMDAAGIKAGAPAASPPIFQVMSSIQGMRPEMPIVSDQDSNCSMDTNARRQG